MNRHKLKNVESSAINKYNILIQGSHSHPRRDVTERLILNAGNNSIDKPIRHGDNLYIPANFKRGNGTCYLVASIDNPLSVVDLITAKQFQSIYQRQY